MKILNYFYRQREKRRLIDLRRILILTVVAFLVWHIGAISMSSHYTQSIAAGNQAAVSKALAWNSCQPEALYRKAVALRNEDPDTAIALLARTNRQQMADARPFLAAADIALAQGNLESAEILVEAALRLKPVDPRIQGQVSRYRIFRNDPQRAIRH